jgi:hypothetical protein
MRLDGEFSCTMNVRTPNSRSALDKLQERAI